VPGISATSARALLTRFGSVAGVLAASPEEWLSVPGIGTERAGALADTLSRRFPGTTEKAGRHGVVETRLIQALDKANKTR
jgi:ERCC4-type nuclease